MIDVCCDNERRKSKENTPILFLKGDLKSSPSYSLSGFAFAQTMPPATQPTKVI